MNKEHTCINTVESVFQLTGRRGIVIVPSSPWKAAIRVGQEISIHNDDDTIVSTYIAGIELTAPSPKDGRRPFSVGENIQKEDVKIGAKIYTASELSEQKRKVKFLLKGIETGNPDSAAIVNEAKYIQHNPLTLEGNEGLAELFSRLSKTSPRVEMVRVFEDQDFVFAHMIYDFSSVKVAFEVFRFEDGFAVEHWDNIQAQEDPNPSGHSMTDGSTEITDHHKTEQNRQLIKDFVQEVLIDKNSKKFSNYVSTELIQHTPQTPDGISAYHDHLFANSQDHLDYHHCHRILAEGNFILAMCEGLKNESLYAFYDLFRIENEKIIEHWDTHESIPDRKDWKNDNGKF